MKIVLKRTHKKADYTIGDLYIDGKWFCNTLEDTDRHLNETTPIQQIINEKICGETAIPTGTYEITLDVESPKYSKVEKFKPIKGRMPRLLRVPGFDGILIHTGNTNKDTQGCILVGKNKLKGRLNESTDTFFKLYDILKKAEDEITITII